MKTKWYNNFSEWGGPEVILEWNLVLDSAAADFQTWIRAAEHPTDSVSAQVLERCRTQLRLLHQAWNETELLAHFIAPVLQQAELHGKGYNFFLERKLTAQFERGIVTGTVDGLVARGLSNPETPYFFLHEYKKTKGSEADPQGQLLITMIAAQHLNTDSGPLYGCYVLGKFWTFVYLDGTTFAESQGYDASDVDELQIIWNILHETKRRIEARVALLDAS